MLLVQRFMFLIESLKALLQFDVVDVLLTQLRLQLSYSLTEFCILFIQRRIPLIQRRIPLIQRRIPLIQNLLFTKQITISNIHIALIYCQSSAYDTLYASSPDSFLSFHGLANPFLSPAATYIALPESLLHSTDASASIVFDSLSSVDPRVSHFRAVGVDSVVEHLSAAISVRQLLWNSPL